MTKKQDIAAGVRNGIFQFILVVLFIFVATGVVVGIILAIASP